MVRRGGSWINLLNSRSAMSDILKRIMAVKAEEVRAAQLHQSLAAVQAAAAVAPP